MEGRQPHHLLISPQCSSSVCRSPAASASLKASDAAASASFKASDAAILSLKSISLAPIDGSFDAASSSLASIVAFVLFSATASALAFF